MPNAVIPGGALLAQYCDARRKEGGNLRIDVRHEIARSDRFAILEAWKDNAARDAHENAARISHFRDSLKAIESAPYDQHVSGGIYVSSMNSEGRAGTIYVLTHVDVTPERKDESLHRR